MVYHIFNYCIDGVWYRDSEIYSDTQFDAVMEHLEWKLPSNMRVFHFGVPGPKQYHLDNPIILRRPVLSLDPMTLATAKPPCKTILSDKQAHLRIPVTHRTGRFVICDSADIWPCFRYVDGKRYTLTTQLQVVPLSFRMARDYVQRYHRHNAAPQGHKFSV